MIRKVLLGLASLAAALSVPAAASAHVKVTPGQVNVGQRAVFTIAVPNERTTGTTMLALDVPNGVTDVTPTVHAGWTAALVHPDPKNPKLEQIQWTNGTIPVGQRDEFTFSAQMPAKAGNLEWKAYQTYADGFAVSWDQPAGSDHDDDSAKAGPFSVTNVIDDTKNAAKPASDKPSNLPLIFSLIALVLSVFAVTRRPNTKHK